MTAYSTSLLNPESGVKEAAIISDNAMAYANALCYLSDPSTIRARVADRFGFSPPIETIRAMRDNYLAERDRFRRASDRLGVPDGPAYDFQPNRLKPRAGYKTTAARCADAIIAECDDIVPCDDVEPDAPPMLWREVVAAVAKAFRVTPADILGKSRYRKHVLPRRTAAFVLIARGNKINQVGRWLNRDKATILHALRAFEDHATAEMRAIAARMIVRREHAL